VTFLNELVDFMSEEPDRLEVIKFIKEYLRKNTKDLFDKEKDEPEKIQVDRFIRDIDNGESFLSRKASYKKIHDIAKYGKIEVRKLDLTSTADIQSLRKRLDEQSLTVDILYISNIGRRIIRLNDKQDEPNENLSAYLKNIRLLADSRTDILDSWLGTDKKLYQRLYSITELELKHQIDSVDREILNEQHVLPPPKWMATK
jgi:hypothetical protein